MAGLFESESRKIFEFPSIEAGLNNMGNLRYFNIPGI